MSISGSTRNGKPGGNGFHALDGVDFERRLALLKECFLTRHDLVAAHNGKHADPCEMGPRRLDAALRAHAGLADPITLKNRHGKELVGVDRFGSYVPDLEGKTRTGSIDVDGGPGHSNPSEDPEGDARKILAVAEALELPLYVERSRSLEGFHLWLLLSGLVPAIKVRALLRALCVRAGVKAEVFPKNNQVGPKGCGNQVWLPWWHGARDGGCCFLRFVEEDRGTEDFEPEDFERLTEAGLDAALRWLGIDPDNPFPRKAPPKVDPNESRGYWTPERLLEWARGRWRNGWWVRGSSAFVSQKEGWAGRNAACFALAGQFRDHGHPLAEAEAHVLTFFGEIVGDGPDDLTEDEIRATIASAYNHPTREPMPVPGQAREGGTSGSGSGAEPVQVGPVALRAERPVVGPKKITFQLVGEADGERVLDFACTSTASSIREAGRQLALHGCDKDEATRAIHRLVARARQTASKNEAKVGARIRDIIAGRVPAALQIHYRTDRALWSEARGAEMTYAEFVRYTPSRLLEEAMKATDAPLGDDGKPSPDLILAPLGRALGVLFNDLMESLPRQEDTEAAPGSFLARQFRKEVAGLWRKLFTHMQIPSGEEENSVIKASPISIVRRRMRETEHRENAAPHRRFERIKDGLDCWWRWYTSEDAESRQALAMTDGLLDQAGTTRGGILERLSGDSSSLAALGEALGVFAKIPGVACRTNARRALCVLSWDLTQELLAEPLEEIEADQDIGEKEGQE